MFADLRPTFPTGPSVCFFLFFVVVVVVFFWGGGGQQASSLSSKHKLWNFHRYRLVYMLTLYHVGLHV